MHLFGLTGGIASGKSAVAARFRARGVAVVDADVLAREVVLPGSAGARRDRRGLRRGGAGTPAGELDRKGLADRVFRDDGARARLNGILHPRIGALTMQRSAELAAQGEPLACYEAALIVENRMADMCRPLVVVSAPEALQVARAMARDGATEDEARARVRAQMPLASKVEVADIVIENTGTVAELLARADDALDAVCARVKLDASPLSSPRMTQETKREPGGGSISPRRRQKKLLGEMTQRALASASLSKRARVAVSFAAAGGYAERMGHVLQGVFGGAEVVRFTVPGEKSPMPADEARAIVLGADLVFVGGGDPVHGARLLVDAGADAWLREARAHGVPCMGVSAGAIMLSAWWADWPEDPPPGAPYDGGELVSCTRVVSDLVVDCHSEEDRWAELVLVRHMLRDRLGDAPRPRMLGLAPAAGIVVAGDVARWSM